MKTLIINAHPNFENKDSFSYKLQNIFSTKYKETFPNEKPEILNLYEINLPRIESTQLLNIWNKQRENELLTIEEQQVSDMTSSLLSQFKSHHRIVIISPLHNFNITSRLKDYIDNIMIARQTFKYTSDGSVGLMTDNYKALYLKASGSIYTNDDRYKPLDFSSQYLQAMFTDIMAFDDFYIARAQGTAILPESTVLQNAEIDLDQAFTSFYDLQ